MAVTLTDYWREVLAPRLKAKKAELGRDVPERDIAAAVESATGQPSQRGLVSLWLLGLREPTITQFVALCKKLELDPAAVLDDSPTPKPRRAIRVGENSPVLRKPYGRAGTKSQTAKK